MTENRYVFDNAVTAETGMRFSGLEATFDPATIGVPDRCRRDRRMGVLEIGAGGGSIASWLAEQVGPTGSVLATDIDPRFIPASELAHLEVVRHDVTADAIPEARYDLIHARLVLSHLPQRGDVMVRLVQALRPGGWLVIEDFSGAFQRGTEPVGPADARSAVQRAIPCTRQRLADLASPAVPMIGGEARVVFGRGGSAGARVMVAGLRQAGDRMIAAGLVDRPALDEAIAYLDTPSSVVSMPTMVSAWGRQAG